MRLVFTVEAKRDLDELRDYLKPLSPKGFSSVVTHIRSRIEAGMANPRIGRPTPQDDVRELVDPKFGFVIPYYIKGENFFVLRVYQARRSPLAYEDLTLPN
jgi:toxin ParE1/3/4